MAFAHGIVIEVVGRRDLDAACSEFHVHIAVCDNLNFAPDQGQFNKTANEVLIPLVLRVHGNGGIP